MALRQGACLAAHRGRHVDGQVSGLANHDVATDADAFLIVVEQEAPTTMMLQVTISPAGLPWAR